MTVGCFSVFIVCRSPAYARSDLYHKEVCVISLVDTMNDHLSGRGGEEPVKRKG